MAELHPYLFFNGNCKQAMNFYKECIGGDLQIMTYADAPPNEAPPTVPKDAVMHASLSKGKFMLMASDGMPDSPITQGENISLSLSTATADEAEKLFRALGAKATVTMPMEKTFWAERFGMLKDQFGVNWMVSCEPS